MKAITVLLASLQKGSFGAGKRLCLFVITAAILFFISTGTTSAHITSLIPSSIIAGSPGFTLRILGFDFDESDTGRVLFDGTRVAATLVSSQELTATIPASLITRPGIVRVALEGFNSVDFYIEAPGSCVYSITIGAGNSKLIGQIFPADGGTGTANIEVTAGCRWVANLIDTNSFASLTSVRSELGGELVGPYVATGSGSGTLTYSLRPNVRLEPRNATIRLFRSDFTTPLPAEPFTITQEGSRCPASSYQISPQDTVRDDLGGSGSIQVTAPLGCEWTAISDQRWIEVQRLGGIGSKEITYTVGRNEGLWRSGNIIIAGKTFSVIQVPSDCFLRTLCAYFPSTCPGTGPMTTIATALRFRDDVLATSPRGQRYIELYYRFSKEAVGSLMLNPMLILRSQEILQRYKPVLESMIKGQHVTLTYNDIEEIESFLDSLAQKGSPELRESLKGLSQDLRDPRVQEEYNIIITDGPMRELSAQSATGRIKKMDGLTTLLGLAIGGLVIVRLSRRKINKVSLCMIFALPLVLYGLTTAAAAQPSNILARNGRTLGAARQLPSGQTTVPLIGRPSIGAKSLPGSNAPATGRGPAPSPFHALPFDFTSNYSKAQPPTAGRRPLTVDDLQAAAAPGLAFATYFGGARNEEGNSIAVDLAGNVYVAGFTDSPGFPLANSSQPTFGGGQQDAFVAKLDPSGTQLLYSTYIGGNGQDNATAIAVDAGGNAYITGYTDSTNFPVRNALQQTKLGNFNAFVVKLNSAGVVVFSTLLGGSVSDYGSSIAVDSAGNVYVAGIATSPNFPIANALQQTPGGLVDAYAAKFDPAGSRLLYSTYLGGAGIDGASSIAVDAGGNAYLTGVTSSPDFRTVNPLQASHGGGLFDAFVVKLNPSGSTISYATYLGGSGEDRGLRIALDSTGSAYATGDTDSPNFPMANATQPSKGGSADAFVAKLSPSGNQLAYSTYLGGSGLDGGTAIAVDAAGAAYVTGFTASPNFPMVSPLQQVFGGGYDGFIAKLSSTGTALDYSTYLGGSGIDSVFGVAADLTGAYVMGVTDSVNFPNASPMQPVFGGGTADVFVAKIKSSGLSISRAEIQGKNLLIFGSGFDAGAKILLNGEQQKTRNDDVNPTGALFGKKVAKKITPGETITLQVRNSDGALSNEFRFTR
jgi:beta-propeller repeat-containing protein/IPT/TIG domain-containing protein